MAQLTKAQLATENAADFPNNNQGLITPAILRGFNTDMIDSLVDEVSYNIDSASFSASIAQLDNFSSSLDATFATDAQLSASVAALSSSIAVTDLAQSASIAALQQFSSSLDGGFVSETEFGAYSSSINSYTASNDSKWNTLGGQTGSYVTEAESGSFVTSVLAGGTPNVISVTKGNGAINTITVNNVTSASFAISSSLAQNVVIIARNGNSSTLPAGTVVHITGASGDNPIFNTASFDTELLSANTLGILRQSAASGADVDVLVNGIVTGVNTNPANGYVAGDIIYLSSSGQFTRVQPQAPNQVVTLGQVLRAQQNNGSIYVNINNGWELNELHNVAINSAADGDLLVYRSSQSLWTNSSSAELGLVTTGSNTFGGTQTMNNLVVNGTASFAYTQTVTGSAVIVGQEYIILNNQTPSAPYAGLKVYDSGSNGVTASLLWDGANNHWIYEQVSGAAYGAGGFLSGPTASSISSIIYPSANRLVKGGGEDHLYDSNISDDGTIVRSAVGVIVTGSITATNGFVGNASTATTASHALLADTASFALNIPNTGSFATTGSNTFVGNQIVSSSIIGVGDLYIQPTNQSTDFSNVSASVSGNIIFGAIFGDSQPRQTGSFVVSGSNNLVLVGKPEAQSGYYSYVNGALNVVGAAVRLSTSSLLRPTMYNNIIQRAVTLNFTTSSFASAPNFGNNLLYGAGTTNINHQSGSINFASNLVGGGNIFTSTQNVTPTSTRVGITSNIFNGTQTFLHQSSSITLDRNIFNGLTAPAIRNDFSNSFADGLTVSRNIVNGNQVLIYNSGSTTAGSAQGNRSITDNLFGGVNIIVSSSHIATNNNNANLVGAIVHGYNLNVSASSTTSTGGNVFVGRNNDTSSNLASTSDIIFAVGTGTSTSARKTGLWIDTGSLTTINGGLYVTQSQVTLTNSGSTPNTLALAVRSGSVEVTSPQGNGYFYTNLPITSSNLRINGDGIISDLFVSGVFTGNSTLRVLGNSGFTGSVDIANNLSVSGGLAITGSNPTIQSGSLSGSLISNLGDIYTGSNNAQYIVTLGSASMATLLSGSTTNANTLYFVI